MTDNIRGDGDEIRARLYARYATTHAGSEESAASAAALRDFRPHLLRVPAGGRVLDIGCGQGALVSAVAALGFDAEGVDRSAEQVALAYARGLASVHHADLGNFLHDRKARYDAIVAVDVLEHLEKQEVVTTFDLCLRGLKPGGTLLLRTPNGASPFFGHYHYGDFTHEQPFTASSLRQLALSTGFTHPEAFPSFPMAAQPRRLAARVVLAALKLALAAQVGTADDLIVTQNLVFTAKSPRPEG